MKLKYIMFIAVILFLFLPSKVFADRGLINIGFEEVYLEESGQNAIVAWNGTEEVLILSTDIKGSKSTYILEVLPLPSNPLEITNGSFGSFRNLTDIFNDKVRRLSEYAFRSVSMGGEKAGVEVMFHNKIGVHDVTVVKVSNIDEFLNWVRGFLSINGLNYVEVSKGFKSVVSRYLDRDIKYFVFDIIEIGVDEKSVEPLIYRFKTEYLYYPLEITAASDVGQTYSRIGIFIITYGSINEDIVRDYGFNPRSGFKYYVEFSKDELKSVSPSIARLFNEAYVMYIDYYGPLNILNKDLVIHGKDIHTPTLLDKLYLWSVKYLGPTILYQFTTVTYSEIIDEHTSITYRVFLTGILISLITGILSVIYIIGSLLKYLMKRYGLRTLGSYLASYIVSAILMASILMLKTSIISITAFTVIIIVGLSTLIYAVIKLIGRLIS